MDKVNMNKPIRNGVLTLANNFNAGYDALIYARNVMPILCPFNNANKYITNPTKPYGFNITVQNDGCIHMTGNISSGNNFIWYSNYIDIDNPVHGDPPESSSKSMLYIRLGSVAFAYGHEGSSQSGSLIPTMEVTSIYADGTSKTTNFAYSSIYNLLTRPSNYMPTLSLISSSYSDYNTHGLITKIRLRFGVRYPESQGFSNCDVYFYHHVYDICSIFGVDAMSAYRNLPINTALINASNNIMLDARLKAAIGGSILHSNDGLKYYEPPVQS